MTIEEYLIKREKIIRKIQAFENPVYHPLFAELNKLADHKLKQLKNELKELERKIEHENLDNT